MKVGARNRTLGRVTDIKKGTVMCQVKLEVPASVMASVMTADSAEEMDLKVGDEVEVIVKAIHVLLVKDQ